MPGAYIHTLLTNGRILTLDDADSIATTIGFTGSRIVYVGDDPDAGGATIGRTIDLEGRTLVPGLIDIHTHVELNASSKAFWISCLGMSVDEFLDDVRARTQAAADGEWIIYQGGYHQPDIDLAMLDEASGSTPVVLRWTMHKVLANSAALRVSGITAATVEAPGMRLGRTPGGALDGVLEEAWDLLAWEAPDEGELEVALGQTLRDAFLAHGVTTVHEIAASAAGVRSIQRLSKTASIPRMGILLAATPGNQPLIETADFAKVGIATGFGSDESWFQAIKIFVDGGRSGAFRSSNIGGPASGWGLLTRTPQGLVKEIADAVSAGIQVAIHATGDLAQEMAVSAIEQVDVLYPDKDHRTRIEHFYCESYGDTALLERLVAARGIAAPNPGFVFAESSDPDKQIPPRSVKYALRTLRKYAGLVPGVSDTAGAQPRLTNPWFVMRCMMTMKNFEGTVITPDESLTFDESLRAYTRDSAYATRQENDKGSLEVGKLADFVVLDEDPRDRDAEVLDTIPVVATVIGGSVRWGALPERVGE
jgi:predicted amidohydrolase YtcJ